MADFLQTEPTNYDRAVVSVATRWFQGARTTADYQWTIWSASTLTFKMRGQDAATNQLDTWLSSGQPDFTGASYKGALTTPLRDIVMIDCWPMT